MGTELWQSDGTPGRQLKTKILGAQGYSTSIINRKGAYKTLINNKQIEIQ
jgi:hypothetical protein